jgi:ribosomal protein S18 acetylase RimI-like enzyme
MSEIKYREATKQDIPKIIELWKEFIDFHKAKDPFFSRTKEGPENFGKFILENLHKDDAIVYVAETNGEVVAYILATIQSYPPVFEIKRYGLINDLAVTSTYRRSGIGEHLFDIAKDWFDKKGMKRVEIEVAVTNEVSTSFWRKMGLSPYKDKCYLEI